MQTTVTASPFSPRSACDSNVPRSSQRIKRRIIDSDSESDAAGDGGDVRLSQPEEAARADNAINLEGEEIPSVDLTADDEVQEQCAIIFAEGVEDGDLWALKGECFVNMAPLQQTGGAKFGKQAAIAKDNAIRGINRVLGRSDINDSNAIAEAVKFIKQLGDTRADNRTKGTLNGYIRSVAQWVTEVT